jgi:hypothetical protein
MDSDYDEEEMRDTYSRQEAVRRVNVMFDVMETLIRERPAKMLDAAWVVAGVMRSVEQNTQLMALWTPGAEIISSAVAKGSKSKEDRLDE